MPLDVLDAESEGVIGYLLARELGNALPGRAIVSVLTQVVVDPADPAFLAPTKPIGPGYGEIEARRLAAARGWTVARDGARFRRVVPSPAPVAIVERDTIAALCDDGVVVICAGGGGIPVAVDGSGRRSGVEAVVDKDRVAALLGRELGADGLLLLTDVDGVYDDFGTDEAALVRDVDVDALENRRFDPGSMGPKVDAAVDFVRATGGIAWIGALDDAAAVVRGDAGTRIRPGSLASAPIPVPVGERAEQR
jgi:carbamate kinase